MIYSEGSNKRGYLNKWGGMGEKMRNVINRGVSINGLIGEMIENNSFKI